MNNRLSLTPFWFCFTLALAFSLAALGLIITVDNLTRGMAPEAHQPLRLSGGIVAFLISASTLALIFKRARLCLGLALVTPAVTLLFLAMPHFWPSASPPLTINPPLLALTLLISIAQINAIRRNPRPLIGMLSGMLLVLLGMLSLLSQWIEPLLPVSVGSIDESNIIVSPLVVLMGLMLPRLTLLFRQPNPAYSNTMLLLGILGITVTLGSWQGLRLHASKDLQHRADAFAEQVGAALAADYTHRLSLVARLAERWGRQNTISTDDHWDQEAASYFRDFPEIRAIALATSDRRLARVSARSRQARQWLDNFLARPDSAEWLHHTTESRSVHHSRTYDSDNGVPLTMVAAPVLGAPNPSPTALAVVDLHDAYSQLLVHHQGRLGVAVSLDGVEVFRSSSTPQGTPRTLSSHRASPHHGVEWQISVYAPPGQQNDDFFLPPLILMTGLGLSFLMMLAHLYWRESEKRSKTLGFHLEQERNLRRTNERILNFSRDLLCTVDRKGRFAMISPACEAIFGYTSEELLGQPADLLMLPEDQSESRELAQQLVTGEKQQIRNFRNRHYHRDGHVLTLSWMVEWSPEEKALFCLGRDITDELVAETLAREQEQFFALSPDMFCIVDLNTHFFELNRAFLTTLGYSRDELLGTSYLELIAEEDRPKVIAAVQQLMDGKTIDDLQLRAVDRQQQIHWLQLSAILSADDLIYVVARDTTRDRETHQKLEESESLLRIAEAAARIGGWVLDVDTGNARWSDAVCEIHDLPPGSTPPLSETLDYYLPEDRPIIEDAVRLCMETGIPFDEELRIRTAKNRQRWVRVIGHAVRDEEGKRVRLQGAMQDVTSARQAMEQVQRFAERQATIFESITDAFYTLDRDWRFIYVNTRSEELLRRSREELLGRELREAFPDIGGSVIETRYREAVETGESVSFEAYYPPVDEWFEISAYPSEEGLAVYYRSISSRKKAEEKLRETMEELERSNRELQDFAFVASHDLQEPLRKIRAFSDRLISKSDHLDEQEKDYLARMQSAAKRMQTLIQDLLSYSRVNTRASPLRSCDPNRILEEVLQDMETTISQERAQIHIEPLPLLEGDASQIRQVFQNLLSNSVKFHQTGHPPEIFIYPDTATEDAWTLVFSDRGIGFESRHAEKMFHPFQRLHQRSQYQGTGIGMAIVKKILDRHGADITVESEPDKGTTFRIRFRRAE